MKNKKQVIWLVLLVFVIAVIFYFSNQRTEISGELSHNVAVSLNIKAQYKWEEPSNIPLFFGMTLRNFAHVFLFALLGLFSMGVFHSAWNSIAFCFFYAAIDEFHQLFVLGRTASLSDVFIDALGFMSSILIVVVCRKINNRLKVSSKLMEDVIL